MAIAYQNGIAHQADSNSNLLSGAQKDALQHLASVDLSELCNEAKVERCRATRDLRSCGRYVRYMLTSCGHASLCAECSQRCDICPICRTQIHPNGGKIRLRLYYECMEAGLISKACDDIFQENEDSDSQLAPAVERLHSLFDVAMENNLVSLICHYITDVCMDESAVSSDPVISFLLDEVVVKDWCKRTFANIKADLNRIYALDLEKMRTELSSLLKISSQLSGISNILEVLETSIKGTDAAQNDLHCLQENVLKAKQHLEIMDWSIRHNFVQNIKSRYPSHEVWHKHFRERKSAATKRAWPDLVASISANSAQQNGATLFIEDALSNLEVEQEYGQENEVESLVKDGSTSSVLKSRIKGAVGCYPFENLQSAADILFLCGSSDMVVAKQAIFLYYMFDRHWSPDAEWRHIIDDFAASFSISRHSVLESLIFYLLDDHSDQALQEACTFLPEIAGPATHPKIAQVLIERQNPDAALMVLRWSGLDGLSAYANSDNSKIQLVPLRDAVIAVRARVECGLLTEAFMYQRTHYMKAKEDKSKHSSSHVFSNGSKGEHESWVDRMESLVTEVCCLCIRRNLVDRMIELPWNSDEEKYIHKHLFEYATEDPSATVGSLLVVFYLQRFRYIEAYQVDCKLQSLEKDCISNSSTSEEVISRIRLTSQWRTSLVDKCIELLPRAQQQQVKSGNIDAALLLGTEAESVSKSNIPEAQPPNFSSLLPSLLLDSSRMNPTSKKIPAFESPQGVGVNVSDSYSQASNFSPSILHRKFLTPVRGTPTSNMENLASTHFGIRDNFIVDNVPTPGIHLFSPQISRPPKESNRSSSRAVRDNRPQHDRFDRVPPRREPSLFASHAQGTHLLYSSKTVVDQPHSPQNDPHSSRHSVHDVNPTFSGKRTPLDRPVNPMDYAWSNGNGHPAVEDMNVNGGLRWRSDETSDEEEEPSPEMLIAGAASMTPSVRRRRRRFSRR